MMLQLVFLQCPKNSQTFETKTDMWRKREQFSFFTNVACRNIPSDGFDLADEICEFFVTCFWQQDTKNRNHDADYSENNKWQNPTVHT